MKRNNIKAENLLEKIPFHKNGLGWTQDENGLVTLEMENKGVANRIFQKLLKKPKVSFIHLDENGSFTWLMIDGKKTVFEIGEAMEEHFGEMAHPVYERLTLFLRNLEQYGFIEIK